MAYPTYVKLNPSKRLAASRIPYLLGSFVTDPRDPNERRYPNTEIDKSELAQPVPSSGKESTSDVTRRRVRARIQALISFGMSKSSENDLDIDEATMTVHSLDNAYNTFQRLITTPDVEAEVRKMVKEHKQAYMIKSLKSVSKGGKMKQTVDRVVDVNAKAKAPVSTAAKSHGIPLPSKADPEVKLGHHHHAAQTSDVTADIEQVYAIEYRIIEKIGKSDQGKAIFAMGKTYRPAAGEGLYSPDMAGLIGDTARPTDANSDRTNPESVIQFLDSANEAEKDSDGDTVNISDTRMMPALFDDEGSWTIQYDKTAEEWYIYEADESDEGEEIES